MLPKEGAEEGGWTIGCEKFFRTRDTFISSKPRIIGTWRTSKKKKRLKFIVPFSRLFANNTIRLIRANFINLHFEDYHRVHYVPRHRQSYTNAFLTTKGVTKNHSKIHNRYLTMRIRRRPRAKQCQPEENAVKGKYPTGTRGSRTSSTKPSAGSRSETAADSAVSSAGSATASESENREWLARIIVSFKMLLTDQVPEYRRTVTHRKCERRGIRAPITAFRPENNGGPVLRRRLSAAYP